MRHGMTGKKNAYKGGSQTKVRSISFDKKTFLAIEKYRKRKGISRSKAVCDGWNTPKDDEEKS